MFTICSAVGDKLELLIASMDKQETSKKNITETGNYSSHNL